VAHATPLATTAPPKQPQAGSEAKGAEKVRMRAEQQEAAAEKQGFKAAAKVQRRSNRLRLIQLRARKDNKAGADMLEAS
jgi:hypothetical protein